MEKCKCESCCVVDKSLLPEEWSKCYEFTDELAAIATITTNVIATGEVKYITECMSDLEVKYNELKNYLESLIKV